MLIDILKSKIHRATITECDIHYEGSISIDEDLLDASGIIPFEKVEIYDITNGARFNTYAIKAERGSKKIGINGAAARMVHTGDLIIICAYARIDEHLAIKQKDVYNPTVILVDENNNIKK